MAELRVATLNIWGLPDLVTRAPQKTANRGLGSASRTQRIQKICARMGDFDVLCLQEVWVRTDRETLVRGAAAAGLHHWHYFHSGRYFPLLSSLLGFNENAGDGVFHSGFGIGSGMLVVSRYPIVATDFYLYTLCGKWQKFWHGDYQGAKGVGLVTVDIRDHLVDIYTTHVVAGYSLEDEYKAHRLTNMMEIVDFMRKHTSSELSILTGDLNNPSDECEVQYLFHQLSLRDTYQASRSDIQVSTHFLNQARLDYVLYPRPHTPWKLKDSFVCFSGPDLEAERNGTKGAEVFYSDHKGVCAEFALTRDPLEPAEAVSFSPAVFQSPCENLLREAGALCQKRQRFHLLSSGVLLGAGALTAVTSYMMSHSPVTTAGGLVCAGILTVSSLGCMYYRSIKKAEERFLDAQLDTLRQQNREA